MAFKKGNIPWNEGKQAEFKDRKNLTVEKKK